MKSIGGSTADGAFFRRAVRTHVPTEPADKISGRFTNIYILALLRVKGTQAIFCGPQLGEHMNQGRSFSRGTFKEPCVVLQNGRDLFFKNSF